MANLQAIDLFKSFGKGSAEVVALNNVSHVFKSGCFSIIRGPSGSGKSSLFGALGGLQAPTRGAVMLDKTNIWKLSETDRLLLRRQYFGFVFQAQGLFQALSSIEQIVFTLTSLGIRSEEAIKRAKNILEEVGLEKQINSLPSQMSGGQNQRVAIARMLAKEPQIILCDEPTSSLDSHNSRLISNLLLKYAKKYNSLVICMTHDDRMTEYGDQIIKIEDGLIKSIDGKISI